MALARRRILDLERPGWVHCISRCVRRAFLCGGKRSHRKQWVEQRLARMSRCFAADVAAFAALSNHMHVVVRMDPSRTKDWSAEEVSRRWHTLFPRRYDRAGMPLEPDPEQIRMTAGNPVWVAERRHRLGDLSWYMRCLNEHIARRANREDDCTGRFWEGRFRSIPLLDQSALLACMVYVDLNPIRAGEADTPENSANTAVKQRIDARRSLTRMSASVPPAEARAATGTDLAGGAVDAPTRSWLAPMSACVSYWAEGIPETAPLSLDTYLQLVDSTGRLLRDDCGSIPTDLADILTRLELDPERWGRTMQGWGQMSGGAVGSKAARRAEAERRGTSWVKNRCELFG